MNADVAILSQRDVVNQATRFQISVTLNGSMVSDLFLSDEVFLGGPSRLLSSGVVSDHAARMSREIEAEIRQLIERKISNFQREFQGASQRSASDRIPRDFTVRVNEIMDDLATSTALRLDRDLEDRLMNGVGAISDGNIRRPAARNPLLRMDPIPIPPTTPKALTGKRTLDIGGQG